MKLNTTVLILWLAQLDTFAAPASAVFDMSALPYWFVIQDAPFLPHSGWLSARVILSEDDMNAYAEAAPDRPLRIVSGKQFASGMYVGNCLRMFKPAAPIEEAVQAAFGQIIGRTVIGVHYRKGQTPDTAFWAKMDATIAATPSVLFYVASDDPAFVEAAVVRYQGHTTVGFKQPKDANNPEGNEQAAIDFFALARTTEILGTAGSGFGELAALYGGISYIPI